MPPVFDQLASEWPDSAAVADLIRFPARARFSDARVLDPVTAIVADCEPVIFRFLIRDWPDRGTAEELAEAVHQLELERAAQPPVIEVTVITPPEGIPRLELTRIVAEKVAEITGPMPALSPEPGLRPRRRRMLTATRRARKRRAGQAAPGTLPPALTGEPVFAVSEDDTPTTEIPVIRDDPPALVEVRVP